MVKRDEEMNDTVLIDNNDTWVKITLNRPDRLNSLNVDLHLALRAALDAARQSPRARQRQVGWCAKSFNLFHSLTYIQY